MTSELIEKYTEPRTIHLKKSEPAFKDGHYDFGLDGLYAQLLFHAQNTGRKAAIISGSIDGMDKLGPVLCGFNPKGVLDEYGDDWKKVFNQIKEKVKPRSEMRDTDRSVWPQYCKTILSAARFMDQFETADDFYKMADFFNKDARARSGLPLLLDSEIYGFGFALSCDFLKELGYTNFPKPDVHLRDIFTALELCPPKIGDYQLFKAIIRVANNANVTPYAADKVFWLIGSGFFYADTTIGSNGHIGSHKEDFIKSTRKELFGDSVLIMT